MSTWDLQTVEKNLKLAFSNNSETQLLKVLKKTSFLFYELFSIKYGISPNFPEISCSGKFRCDFAWLNDNSGGPECVLVEVKKPEMKLFTKKNEPSSELYHSIEQVKSWDRYFKENPFEKKTNFWSNLKI